MAGVRMSVVVNDNGTLRPIVEGFVNDNGFLRLLTSIEVNDNNTLRTINFNEFESVYGNWSNRYTKTIELSRGSVAHYTHTSALLNEEHGYSLYMPYPYFRPATPLPVIYRFHGKGGSERSAWNFVQYVNAAIKEGVIRPVAVVFVNGGRYSYFTNSQDGEVPVEDVIMTELIPHVESTHSIGGQRDRRMLEGFSMGGFGALKLAFTYPEDFLSVSVLGAALLSEDWPPWTHNDKTYVSHWNSDYDYFLEETPQYIASQNYNDFDGLGIRLCVGLSDPTKRYNYTMEDHLDDLGVTFDFVELAGVTHNTSSYYDNDSYGSFVFHEQMLDA